ncbi:MAG: magnesium and cobalt transport protein CorA [Gammaproteobacteria bacterium HGW-Gammaproteobacteria-3]|nr:MAG: magnesium and cobalt transport protein CorA [Gammaproteobacteria bacterium HGW-Gammaproteobacteria-3]
MLRLCTINNRILTPQYLPKVIRKQLITEAKWVDAYEPEHEERELLQTFLRTELPDSTEVEEIEASARYFVDSFGIHIHSLFLGQKEGRSQTVSVAFILHADRLITLRKNLELADFRLLRMRARKKRIEVANPRELLLTIFEQKVENLADTIEDIFGRLGHVSYQVLEEEGADNEDSIDQLAKLEDTNGKIRLCLMDTQRSLAFLLRQMRGQPECQETIHDMMRDIDTLLSHTAFLFEKINFLMDAALGFINIEQNQIIKTFSIAAVVFMPPTLIASIYGMNFEYMPELKWLLGYPGALVLMVLSGIAPYWFFKRKGWL